MPGVLPRSTILNERGLINPNIREGERIGDEGR
jgi:hypothetical protein